MNREVQNRADCEQWAVSSEQSVETATAVPSKKKKKKKKKKEKKKKK